MKEKGNKRNLQVVETGNVATEEHPVPVETPAETPAETTSENVSVQLIKRDEQPPAVITETDVENAVTEFEKDTEGKSLGTLGILLAAIVSWADVDNRYNAERINVRIGHIVAAFRNKVNDAKWAFIKAVAEARRVELNYAILEARFGEAPTAEFCLALALYCGMGERMQDFEANGRYDMSKNRQSLLVRRLNRAADDYKEFVSDMEAKHAKKLAQADRDKLVETQASDAAQANAIAAKMAAGGQLTPDETAVLDRTSQRDVISATTGVAKAPPAMLPETRKAGQMFKHLYRNIERLPGIVEITDQTARTFEILRVQKTLRYLATTLGSGYNPPTEAVVDGWTEQARKAELK